MRLLALLLFFSAPPTTAIYTLSLHDALPIWDLTGLEDLELHLGQLAGRRLSDRQVGGLGGHLLQLRWRWRHYLGLHRRRLGSILGRGGSLGRWRLDRDLVELLGGRLGLRIGERLLVAGLG